MNVLNEEASREVNNDTIDTTKALEMNGKDNPEKAPEIEDKQAELLRKAKLEEEIRESSIFKNLQSNLNGQYNLEEMLEMIGDNYLKMASTPVINTLNVPISVDSEILKMAFGEFIYLVSVIENGIVLDSSGEIDVQATLEQRQMMTYDNYSVKELMELGTVVVPGCEDMSTEEKYQLLLSDNVKAQVLGLQDVGLTSFYSVEKQILEMNEMLREEVIFETYKTSQSEEVKEEEADKADKCFYNSKKEVKYDMNLVEALAFMHGEGEEKDFLNLQKKMWKKGNYNCFFDYDGKLNEEKIQTYLQEKADSYAYKEHKQIIDAFVSDSCCDYDLLLDGSKRRILYSIYDVASKEDSNTKEYAFYVMKQINPDLIKKGEDGKKDIDIDVLLEEFRKAGKEFASKEDLDKSNEDYNLTLFQNKLKSLSRNKNFQELKYATEAEKREKQKKIKKEGKERENKTTHQGTKVYRTERILNEVLGDRPKEEKNAIIALVYARAIQEKNDIREDFLGDYILEHKEEFKEYEGILDGTANNMEFEALHMVPSDVYEKLLKDDTVLSKVYHSLRELENRKTREEKTESFSERADGMKAHVENLLEDFGKTIQEKIPIATNFKNLFAKTQDRMLPAVTERELNTVDLNKSQKMNIIIPQSKEFIASTVEQAVQSEKKIIDIATIDAKRMQIATIKAKNIKRLEPGYKITMKPVRIEDRYKIPPTLDEAVATGVKPGINSGRVKEDSEMGDTR